MNVVVIEETPGEYALLGETLQKAGYAMRIVPLAGASAALATEMPDIAVAGCRKGITHLETLSKALGASAHPGHRALIAVAEGPLASARVAACKAGATDVVLATADTSDVVDHVASSARTVATERKLRERVAELETMMRKHSFSAVRDPRAPVSTGSDKKGGMRFLLSRAWTSLEETLCGMFSEYLQHPFEEVSGGFAIPQGAAAASIGLTDVANELALELTFFTKPETARVVAAMFTGDASIVDDDVMKDVLLELANSGMGAVRTAFLEDGFEFAPSTPKSALPRPPSRILDGVEAKRMLTFRHGDARVHVIVALRSQARIKLPCAQLKEGMVLATDVLNAAGLLLIRAGTRLTETSAGRIAQMVPHLEVELADAA